MTNQGVHFLPRARRFAQRMAIRTAQWLGPVRRMVPFRRAMKRALGLHEPTPSPRETSLTARLAAFAEARAVNGGVSEAGLEWLISRAPWTERALNYADSTGGRQIETALRRMEVAISGDNADLAPALAARTIVIFQASDPRLGAARKCVDRQADLIVVGARDDADARLLRFGAMAVLPAAPRQSAEAA